MANKTSIILNKMKSLEKELSLLKIEAFLNLRKMANKTSIVERTSGILGKKFPKGVKYENLLRKDWNRRFKELKI